jgi:NADP-dependent 3-hydroxy acid dehydrogenase YdfG
LSLDGKSALVTGASRGIGAEVARALAIAGARVALVARSREKLEAIAAEIGNRSFAVAVDLANRAGVEAAVKQIHEVLGQAPDIIVNNAGIFAIRGIEQTSSSDFDSMLGLNLSAPLAIIREFLPDMKSRASGHVVTVGSIADRQIFAGNAEYSATKFGARAIHEVLREETRGTGVRATLVSPAAVDTDIWDPIHYYGSDARPDRSRMLPGSSVAGAILYALTQPDQVNIDEIRLSRS